MLMPAPWGGRCSWLRACMSCSRAHSVSVIHPKMAENGCNSFKAVRSFVSTCLRAKKREIRQAGIQVAVDSTDHYTNEDVVLSSPSPRMRENTSAFRELNRNQQSFEDSYWSPA